MQFQDKLGRADNNKRIGEFLLNLNQVIGKGSFGEVVLAQNEAEGQLVACKILTVYDKPTKQLRAIEREIEVLQQITKSHPNIVRFYKALRTQNNVYMFLEFCDQGDLKHFIATRSLS
jgi:serine/threonine-protein kinase ULK/ATG1